MEGEPEEVVVMVGLGVRGVNLTMGGMLLWEDFVRVACIGVMKLDCGWGWTPERVCVRAGEDFEGGVCDRRGAWKVLGVMCEADGRVWRRG